MKYLISADALNKLLNTQNNVILLDCRFTLNDAEAGEQAYLAGHIPGAHYLHLNRDLSSAVARHGGRHPLPDFTKLQKTLKDFGANQDTHFIIYDAHKGAYACRAWWLLAYCGVDNVSILNGGLAAWQKDFPLSMNESPAKSSHADGIESLRLLPGKLKVRTAKDIVDNNHIGQLIDSRERPRYQGITEPIDPIAGHIPGAVNLPWQTATTEDGLFLEAADSRQRLANLLGKRELPTVYCGSGVTACVNIFALAQLGVEAALYPGSWSDWCSYTTAENSSARVATSRD